MAKTTVKNVNKDMLVSAIVAQTDLTKKDVEAVIEAMVDTITKELSGGSKVTLTGFGTFKVSQRAAREGINPQTKAKITIPAMTVPKFTAGKSLKEAVK
ncbi:MAG: HU family DNA-binding protein [Candidatus Moranbacteria bacterium]|nr:HU family DNA-binding protein [Candidatus Moranbacteria bacterium]